MPAHRLSGYVWDVHGIQTGPKKITFTEISRR